MSAVRSATDETAPTLVRAAAALHRSLPAVVDADGRVVDHAGLVAAADQVAAALIDAGLRTGEPVGVRHERGAALVAAWLGVGFAGGVYVPLSPDDPDERSAALLDQVGVAVLLDEGHDEPVRRSGVTPRCLTVDGPPAEQPLYVMFTSGSSGRPKAVVVPHRAVLRLVRDPAFCPFAPGDRVGFASNQMFDAATWEVWGPLLCGAAVVTVPRSDLLDHRRLAPLLRDRKVSHLMLTTSLFDRHCRSDPTMFGPLRSLLVGGEPLDPVTVREVLRSGHPPAELLDVYGPTEATTFTTYHRVVDVPEGARRVPIGRPIAGSTVAVVDEHGRSCPPGEPGELWIGGSGVALGYLDDPHGTAEKFVDLREAVDDRAGTDRPPVDRWYRSGDLAVIDADGVLDCLGRIDEQVKIYGYRIEPAEVEAALGALPGVAACAVVAEHDGAAHRLVAYVVAADGATLDPGSVRGALQRVLPRYLVPHLVVVVDDLPLTSNGKLDRGALAELPRPTVRHDAGFEASFDAATDGFDVVTRPATALVATGWRRVLGHADFGPDDDFDEVGGDSMALIELVTWLGQVSRSDAASLLASTGPLTVKRMADELERSSDGWSSIPPLVSLSIGPGPLLALLPAAGGTIFGSRWLAAELSTHFRVVAGNAVGLDGRGRAVRSVGDAAQRWIDEWGTAGLSPPEVLVGFSSGAVVAHEVAARLERRDGGRRLLVMVDPPIDVGCRTWLRAQAERIPHDRQVLRERCAAFAHWSARRPLPLHLAVALHMGAAIRQVHHHCPRRVDGPVLLLVADRRDDVGHSPTAVRDALVERWTPWCADVRVEWVTGTHLGADSVIGRAHAPATATAIIDAALGFASSAVEPDPQLR